MCSVMHGARARVCVCVCCAGVSGVSQHQHADTGALMSLDILELCRILRLGRVRTQRTHADAGALAVELLGAVMHQRDWSCSGRYTRRLSRTS